MVVLSEIAEDINRTAERHVVTLTFEDRRPDCEITRLYTTFERFYGPVTDWPSFVIDAQDHAGVVSIAAEQIAWAKQRKMKFRVSSDRQRIDNSIDVQFTFRSVKDAIFFKLRWC